MSEKGFGGLVPYFEEFVPTHLRLKNGNARTRRSAQDIAKKYSFPIVRVGLRAFIDPDLAAQHLIEAQIHDRAAPRRGRRPRKIAAAGEK